MIAIRLTQRSWEYDPAAPLGKRGGFGSVFLGRSSDLQEVAVKRLHLSAEEAAHRELALAEDLMRRPLTHVMPILDAGLDAESDSYFLVMPRAEKSLEDELRQSGPLPEPACIEILQQVVEGLLEIPHIVHRDMKPANILLHEGVWKVADFGIARFVEESTSARTLKRCMTCAFAAPEQWLEQHASNATDVYALGCIAHAILRGAPPFPGPSPESYREQHCAEQPPGLPMASPILRSLITHMLRKFPDVRPSLLRLKAVLEMAAVQRASPAGAEGSAALAEANARVTERMSEEEARSSAESQRREERQGIARDAYATLAELAQHLFDRVASISSAAAVDGRLPVASELLAKNIVNMGVHGVELSITLAMGGKAVPQSAFQRSGWTVYAGAVIEVRQPEPAFQRSASLWFTNLGREPECRWYEVSYFMKREPDSHRRHVPFGTMDFNQAGLAAGPAISGINFAHKPLAVDLEGEESFIERWVGILALALKGELRTPRQLPLA
jgi:serine/threonine-protein kinase